MLLLVLLSIISLTIVILRGMALRYHTIIPRPIQEAIDNMQPGQSTDRLHSLLDASPLANVVRVVLKNSQWPKTEAMEAAQARARHEIARMETGLVILEIATGVAPLFGLLGTLSGLVGIFANLSGTGDPSQIAFGISEALNTTIMGLAVAAPSLIAYNYFIRKIEMMSIEMEALVNELLDKRYEQTYQSYN